MEVNEAVPATARPRTPSHIPALDGVRALAILFVLALHFSTVFNEAPYHQTRIPHLIFKLLEFGWCGVDLFFALSGFLITGILLDSKGSETYFSRFYWRRALRIFPVYYLFLFCMFGILGRLIHPNPWADINKAWYVFYLSNWGPGHGSEDKLVGHAWSLAVEEQFYLVWPTVIFLLPRRAGAWLCGVLAIAALAIRCWLWNAGAGFEAVYRLTPARMDALVLGGLMAICIREPLWRAFVARLALPVIALCAVVYVSVAIAAHSLSYSHFGMATAGLSALAIGFSLCVFLAAGLSGNGAWRKLLTAKPLRSIGKYSYTMYLVHIPLHRIIYVPIKERLAGRPDALIWAVNFVYLIAITAIVYTTARLSWKFFESRILAWKDRIPLLPAK
jgi:peptidoglycan/LPS O-acetylase OafA/YrhL